MALSPPLRRPAVFDFIRLGAIGPFAAFPVLVNHGERDMLTGNDLTTAVKYLRSLADDLDDRLSKTFLGPMARKISAIPLSGSSHTTPRRDIAGTSGLQAQDAETARGT